MLPRMYEFARDCLSLAERCRVTECVCMLPRKHDYSRLRVSGFAQRSLELYSFRVMLWRRFPFQFSQGEKNEVLCSSSSNYASPGVLLAEVKLGRASLPSIYCVRRRRRFAISWKHGRTREHFKESGTLANTRKQSGRLPHTQTHSNTPL